MDLCRFDGAPCQVASTLRNEIEMHVERAAYSSEFRWCMSPVMALFVIRDLSAIWSLLGQQQTLIRTPAPDRSVTNDPNWTCSGLTAAKAPRRIVPRENRIVGGSRLAARIGPQGGDSFEEHPAMTNRTNADFLEVLLGQVRENPLVDLVVAECRLVFFEAQAPQPDHHVHDGAHNQWWRASSSGIR
jgi:hypothetical protein